ncbi:MAG TPA: hypothetical protein ENI51_04990 [Candidatus Atribacteria bacterium]|nr:hypothetical protein [Candidatus Atribacteria bacterium]
MALQFGILKAPFILTPLSVLILFAGIFFTIAKYGIGKIWLDISTKELQLILEVLLLLIISVINIIFVSAILKIILTLFLTVIFIIFNQQILLFFMRSFFRRDMQLLTSSKIFINEILTSPSLSDLFSKIVKFYYETLNPENVYLYHWNKKNELVLLIRKGDKEGKNLKFTRSFFEVFKKMNFSEVVEIKRVLYLSEEVRKIFNIFKETEARIIIPYYCGDEILYFLILSSKKNNAPYRKVEIEIMNKHTGFIITSIKNIFLFEELKNIRYIKKFNQVVTRISNELILSTKRLKILNRNNIFKVKNQIIHSIKKMKIMVGVIKGAIV